MNSFEDYKFELDRLRQELENDNDVQGEVTDLEHQIKNELEFLNYKEDDKPYLMLLKEIAGIKREFDFYDEAATLDMMFPDRHDDDFDEDSMSAGSVFGDD